MNTDINNLSDFDKMKSMRSNIKKLIEKIKSRTEELKTNYSKYAKNESDDFFGLDSFQFQIKMLKLEFDDIYKMYVFLENRIYGDYFKLLMVIKNYIFTNLKETQYRKIKELQGISRYPVYKDLESFKKYDFHIIYEIHHDIIMIIHAIGDILKDNDHEIRTNEQNLVMGIKIDNYINNYKFKNESLRIAMYYYNNYLQVYHKYHYDLLNKFLAKIQLVKDQLYDGDIDPDNETEI